jgi:hypothetical protein
MLIDALAKSTNKDFLYSNLIFKNGGGVKAVFMLEGLRTDLFKFAHDPNANPVLPPMPLPPQISENTPQEEAKRMVAEFNELKQLWFTLKEANELKVPESDFFHIESYLKKYETALGATPSIKGLRFFSFTKNSERENKGGFLSSLAGRKPQE